MESATSLSSLTQNWLLFAEKDDQSALLAYLKEFLEIHQRFYDPEFTTLTDRLPDEGPHLTQLPESVLEKLGNQLKQCNLAIKSQLQQDKLELAEHILKCLVVICRNYDNIMLVASCDFVGLALSTAQVILSQLCKSDESATSEGNITDKLEGFVRVVLHLMECIYDPYYVWRRRLKELPVHENLMIHKPALVNSEVIPFIYECFQKTSLSAELQFAILQMFGAVMSGSQTNAVLAVTPASVDIVLRVLSGKAVCCAKMPEEKRGEIQVAALHCLTSMVHTLHTCSPDQRQVEIPEVMDGYVNALLGQRHRSPSQNLSINMLDTVCDFVKCNDKQALQVQLVTEKTFDGMVALLKSASGDLVLKLACSVVKALQALISGSKVCKNIFEKSVGYTELFNSLKVCGQPSKELLLAVMDLCVESDYSVLRYPTVRNTPVAIILLKFLGEISSHDLQIWLAEELRKLCTSNYGNRMACCTGGMVTQVLSLLAQHSKLQLTTIGHLVCILERLGALSITSSELKQLIALMKPDNDGKQFPYTTRLMRAISTMARRDGCYGPLHFFDIQHLSDFISLPGLRKWPGQAFSFFSWMCLDTSVNFDAYEGIGPGIPYRRLLYSLSSSAGSGFEAFITPAYNLTVASFSKKEFSTVTATEDFLGDNQWHSIGVVYLPGRRFSNSPGSVFVYIDGRQRISAPLKFPNIAEPFSNCKIGSPGARVVTESANELFVMSGVEPKRKSALKALFGFAVGSRGSNDASPHVPGVQTLSSGAQEETWGSMISLHGQLESVCLFHDVLQHEQVKALNQIGPSSVFHFTDDPIIADLPSKLIARYSAKACKGQVCADLSPNQNHGMFSGNRCCNWDVKDVINCLGGVQVLFPLLENLDQSIPVLPDECEDSPSSPCREEAEELDLEDWVMANNTESAELRLEHNQLAAFITMLRYILKEKPVNKDIFVRNHCATTLGMLMQKVPRDLMDVNVLMAVQYLVEDCDDHMPTKSTLLQHIYHYILFDFSLWSKTQFAVRIGHIQYLSTIIKDDRKYFRKKYGVQFLLDVIRAYYSNSSESGLGDEDAKTIRVSLLNLIKYFIIKDITSEELNHIMGFILAVKESTLVLEALDLLISLLDSRSRKLDQLVLLLYEPDQAEMLYQLLTYPHQPIIFYEKVVKVLYLLLKSERVYEKSKARLRLADIGHWGLVNLMMSYDISAPMIKRFMEQVSFTETPQTYSAVLAILSLVHQCGLDIKSEASRQLLAIIVSKTSSAKGFAKHLGWQENITRLIAMDRKRTYTSSDEHSLEADTYAEAAQEQPQSTTATSSPPTTTASSSETTSTAATTTPVDVTSTTTNAEESSNLLVDISDTVNDTVLSDPGLDAASNPVSAGNVNLLEPMPSTDIPAPTSQEQNVIPVTTNHLKSFNQAKGDGADLPSSFSVNRPSALPLQPITSSLPMHTNSGKAQGQTLEPDDCDFDPLTPMTPYYIRRGHMFDELPTPEGEEASDNVQGSRSSSASVEDLLKSPAVETPSDHNVSSSASNYSIASSSFNDSCSFDDDSALGSTQTLENSSASVNSEFSRNSTMVDNSGKSDTIRRRSAGDYLDGSDRRVSSVLRGDTFRQVLDHIGVERTDALEQMEELCQNILIVLLSIMWKGVEGSSHEVWKERCQVFTWIDELGESHILIRPPEEIKRRLMEMLLHNCTTDIRNAGQVIAAQTENAIELIRLVQSFVTGADASPDRFSIRLLEDLMSLLDVLGVWDTETGVAWREMVHRGISILLAFSKQQDLNLVSAATVKLHSLVQTKLINSSAEASYILGVLNAMITQAIEENLENYAYLMPVLKALIDKGQELLTINVQLPHLPKTSMSPTFFDDFKTYVYSEEWQRFINNYICPQMSHFMESNFEEGVVTMSQFWSDCHEAMMMTHHRHNREIGESRLRFKTQIEEVYKKKVEHENRRFQHVLTQQKNLNLFALRQWRANKRFFTGERGAWREGKEEEVHWKLSSQENFARMKVKLTQNYNFDDHKQSSRLRDNQGIVDASYRLNLEELKAMKDALVSKDNIADDSLGDEEWSVISASSAVSEPYTGKEKLVISADCELITVVDEIRGRLEVTTTHVYFFDCSPHRDEAGEDFKWALARLREIHFRRYNLRRSALEIFLIDQTNYFINFPEKKMRNKIFSNILSLRPPNLIYKGQRSPADLLRASGLTQKWILREISNFEYLMQLNTIAGRTYNDLSQYPVFPWILTDYSSKHLDLTNPDVFRDLNKPIGVVNPRNEEEVREKFDTFEDPTGTIEKFHYGTHYSNAASVMHYMVRVEPFTTLHVQLQSGKFDVADRQFHSIPASFYSLMENPNDVKELIPEFFYFPEFLVNFNGFDLGKLQITKEVVNDVKLPPWASTPEEFIFKHRQALESEYVSLNLHNWIDLIFGYKQKGPAAVEALNVFYYVTYEGAVDLDAIQDPKERASVEGMIRNFGQTPSQLLKEPHPQRLPFDEAVVRSSKSGKPMSVFNFLKELKPFFVEVSNDLDPLVYVNVPRSQSRSLLQQGMPDNLITVTDDGVLGIHGWLPFDKSIPNFYTFDKDATMLSPKTKKRIGGPFSPGLKVTSKLFVVSHDAKLLFSGGYWDNSIQVYNVTRATKLINHIVRHIDIVTCLALDNCGRHLVTGSRDTTCMVWEIIQQAGVSTGLNPRPLQTLYGHDSEVTAVHISTELDLVVSASKDGTVILHTVLKGHYTMTLRAPTQLNWPVDIPHMGVSDTGQIVLYCVEMEQQNRDGKTKCQERHCLHLYSVNGKHLFSDPLEHALGDLIMSGDHLIMGNTAGQLEVREIFGLKPITTMELLVPINCVAVSNGNSHILAGLKDGKLIIIGNKGKS